MQMSAELKEWDIAVKENAGYVCQNPKCPNPSCGKDLVDSHHIKSRKEYPEFMYDLDNGICLCIPCHILEHTGDRRVQEILMNRLRKILHF